MGARRVGASARVVARLAAVQRECAAVLKREVVTLEGDAGQLEARLQLPKWHVRGVCVPQKPPGYSQSVPARLSLYTKRTGPSWSTSYSARCGRMMALTSASYLLGVPRWAEEPDPIHLTRGCHRRGSFTTVRPTGC